MLISSIPNLLAGPPAIVRQDLKHDSLFNRPSQYWHMGVEENDDKPINLLEVQPEMTEEEPIEKVFSQEPSTESEDRERFDETTKFEEEVDTLKVEPKSERKQARKSKVTRKSPARVESEDKFVSQFHSELRRHSEARKKAEREILHIRKELKDLLLVHHATIKDLQKTSITDAQKDCHN